MITHALAKVMLNGELTHSNVTNLNVYNIERHAAEVVRPSSDLLEWFSAAECHIKCMSCTQIHQAEYCTGCPTEHRQQQPGKSPGHEALIR